MPRVVLRLKKHDRIMLGNDITLVVQAATSGNLHIVMDAPQSVSVIHKKARDAEPAGNGPV